MPSLNKVKVMLLCGNNIRPETLYTGSGMVDLVQALEENTFIRMYDDETLDYPIVIQSRKILSIAFDFHAANAQSNPGDAPKRPEPNPPTATQGSL